MRFEFATATRIIFGAGASEEAAVLAGGMGRRAFVLTGRNAERAAPFIERLKQQGVATESFAVTGEPATGTVLAATEQARAAHCDVVVAFGGGSVLDTGKVVSALLANGGGLMDYLEVIGRGQPLRRPAVPCVAIPTTAGTGAEVTRNAVIASPEHRVKASVRSPLMLPRLAVVDPALTTSMPPAVTASTGLDALTQLMEAFVCNAANPLTDGVCREGLRRAARSLRRACEDGNNAAAREDMSMASLFGGLALANARLGAVHGFAGVLGGMFAAPHGVICARLLPYVMEANARALVARGARGRGSPASERFEEVARIVSGRSGALAEDGVAWMRDLCAALKIPSLAQFGLNESDFPAVVAQSQKASSMKGNPLPLTDEELTLILKQAAS